MPVYDYQCDGCGARTEHYFDLARVAPDKMSCPACMKTSRRIISVSRRPAPGQNRDGFGVMDDHPAWIYGQSPDPRDPMSPSRGIVDCDEFLAGREQGITSRSQREALKKKYNLRNPHED